MCVCVELGGEEEGWKPCEGKLRPLQNRAVIILLKEPNDSICARTVKLAFSGSSLVLFFFFDPRTSAVLLLCLNVSAHLAYSDSLSFSPIPFFLLVSQTTSLFV